MGKQLGTLLAALLTGALGFVGAQAAIGATSFAARAGTMGSIVAMTIFFAVILMTRSVSDGLDVRAKVKTLSIKRAHARTASLKDMKSLESVARVTQRALLMGPDHLTKTRVKLLRAGYFSDRALFSLILLQAGVSLLGPASGFLAFASGVATLNAAAIGLSVAAIGWYGPSLFLQSKTSRRQAQLFVEFPDALDLIVVYVESGTAFDTALVRVIETLQKRYPTVAGELKLLEHELRYFANRAQAFDNLALRCNIDVVSRLAAIVQQSEQIGSPIAESLKILAKDSRDERFLLAERKAAKLPVIMQLPIVLFILPSLFLFILGPIGIRILDVFESLLK